MVADNRYMLDLLGLGQRLETDEVVLVEVGVLESLDFVVLRVELLEPL